MSIYFGACYYPEHYESEHRVEMIEKDIELMKQLQFNVVRIGEFAWCELEPEEEKYDFSVLDQAIEALGKQGIYTVLCTPTAAPPVWLSQKHPDIRYVSGMKLVYPYGGRRFTCYNSPVYRKYSEKIVTLIAKRYGSNPYVIGFQVDNEFAQERNGRCQCGYCQDLFKQWLKGKYRDISNLNNSWGTIFWGQKYNDFQQVLPPVTLDKKKPDHNIMYQGVDSPSLRLDFERFCSASMVSYYNLQYEILTKYSDKPVTTNSTGTGTNEINYYDMFKNSDVTGMDHYPATRTDEKINSAFQYAHARGIKNNSFWMLETLCGGGYGNWAFQGMRHEYPGSFKNNMMYAYASGAELITMFKFHGFKWGFEQLGSSLMDLDRVPRRRFYELSEAGKELANIKEILERTKVSSRVAMIFDYDSLWATKIKPIHNNFSYLEYLQSIFKSTLACGTGIDIISRDGDFSTYDLLILPAMTIMDQDTANKIKQYTENGGYVLGTYLTAVRDVYGNGTELRQPIHLDDLFGIGISEVEPVFDDIPSFVSNGSTTDQCCIWLEQLELYGAQALLRFKGSYRDGLPTATVNNYGKGKAYYLGCGLSMAGTIDFIQNIVKSIGIMPYPIQHSKRVSVVERTNAKERYYFVFNNAEHQETIRLMYEGQEILRDVAVSDKLELKAKEYCVIKYIL